uniref:Uncharacterized protein n=1 Tax=Picea glauca TaxID=3330 RepID=A0A124GNI6_PICGL|nr:hypothetical protein ABT39_MTgene4272 [Picea glauca]QHR90539.1 hypothetical protein Q903MT_gene4564 [Picea sitchensis]
MNPSPDLLYFALCSPLERTHADGALPNRDVPLLSVRPPESIMGR